MDRVYTNKGLILGCLVLLISLTASGQNGIITTKRSAPRGFVSFSATSVLTGISNTKHIDGYVKKNGTSSFTFPVGDNGVYRPFAAAADGTTGAYFSENPNSTTALSGAPFLVVNKESTIATVSTKEFWDIDGANTSRLTLTWNAASAVAALTENTINRLTITGWNSSASRWEKIASSVDATSILGGQSTLTAGSITSTFSTAPNTYSVYTLAAVTTDPLPVTLIRFTASPGENGTVRLNWVTAAETNSKQFDIQQSADGKTWYDKGTVQARGESVSEAVYEFIDENAAIGENLYRLKMIDRDETFAYSKIESVRIFDAPETSFYPNPVSERLFLKINDAKSVQEINISDLNGNSVYKANNVSASGIDVRGLNTGMYLIRVVLKNGSFNSQKIIVTK